MLPSSGTDRLARVQNLIRRCSRVDTPGEVAHLVAEELLGGSPAAEGVAVALLTADQTAFEFVATSGIATTAVSLGARLPNDPLDPTGAVIATGRTSWIASPAEAARLYGPQLRPRMASMNLGCIGHIPLIAAGRPVGYLAIGGREPGALAPDHLEFVEVVAQYAAEALARTLRTTHLQETTRRWIALQQVTAAVGRVTSLEEVARELIDGFGDAVGADYGILGLLTPERRLELLAVRGVPQPVIDIYQRLSLFASPYPMAEAVRARAVVSLTSREAVYIRYPEMQRELERLGVQSAWIAPVFLGDEALGALALWFTRPATITPDMMGFVHAIGGTAGQAIDRVRRTEAEHHARLRAEEANEGKAKMMRVLSHELRTPLTTIVGTAELLKLQAESLPEGKGIVVAPDVVNRIIRAGEHMTTLTTDVLEFVGLESGQVPVARQEAAVCEPLRLAVDLLEERAAAAGVILDVAAMACGCRAYMDTGRVTQILLNLLTNAIAHTPGGAAVRVTCEADAAWVRVAVADHGPGVAPEIRDALFLPFDPKAYAARRERTGMGLGLAISRELARRMGGDLTCEPAGEPGARFVLRLPRASGDD